MWCCTGEASVVGPKQTRRGKRRVKYDLSGEGEDQLVVRSKSLPKGNGDVDSAANSTKSTTPEKVYDLSSGDEVGSEEFLGENLRDSLLSFKSQRSVNTNGSANNVSASDIARAMKHTGNSAESFFDGESESERNRRRSAMRKENSIARASSLEDERMVELQNKLLDWDAKHKINEEVRRMNKMFEQTSFIEDKSRRSLMIQKYIRRKRWMDSVLMLDPRFQIHSYFLEVARNAGPLKDPLTQPPIEIIRQWRRASSFSVWRPTSFDAISLMIRGEACGKGMDVKGKSAKKGELSGLIPFIQIYEDKHKEIAKLGLSSSGRLRIYYKSNQARHLAARRFDNITKEMMNLPDLATCIRREREEDKKRKSALGKLFSREPTMKYKWDVDDHRTYYLDECGFGLDVPERIFYEACVMRENIKRVNSWETGRPSEPNFQSMNFESTRSYDGLGPRPVVYQLNDENPMWPQSLVVAYEENKAVIPVCSDFDCFTVATRGVVYDEPMAREQVEFMKWMVKSVGKILDTPQPNESWTGRWFEVLDGIHSSGKKLAQVPRYGFGDPKSYKIMEDGVTRFSYQKNGAVRHGAECFNYKFPQEIDDELLVIMDSGFDGTSRPFKYVKPPELQKLMIEKIDEGFIFPINPKWVLADEGWKKVYDKLMSSTNAATQISLESWYPKDSGIRQMIEKVYRKHPDGFHTSSTEPKMEGTEALDLMRQRLKRRAVIRRAKAKIRAVRCWSNFSNHIAKQTKLPPPRKEQKKILEKKREDLVSLFKKRKEVVSDIDKDPIALRIRKKIDDVDNKLFDIIDDDTTC